MERERDDAELDQHLLGRSHNLHLWSRLQTVLAEDPDFAAAYRRRIDLLTELQDLYLIGLTHVSQVLHEIRSKKTGSDQLRKDAERDAQSVLRGLDRQHLSRVAEIEAAFFDAVAPHARPAVVRHRAEVAQILGDCEAVVLPGGHVGELLDALHLFNIVPAGLDRLPIIAWSAGAMVLTPHVVLFNDNAIRSNHVTEMFDLGLGILPDVVLFPGARQRLDLADHVRMGGIVSRYRPARCVPLDSGFRATIVDGQWPADTTVFDRNGLISAWQEVNDAEAGDQPTP